MNVKPKIILLLAALVVGCSAPKIAVENVSKPVLNGLTAVAGSVTVRSDDRRDLTIRSADVTVHYADRVLCTARLAQPIRVEGGTTSEVGYQFDIQNVDLGAALVLGGRVLQNLDRLTFDVDLRARLGCLGRRIKRKNLTFKELQGMLK